MMCISSHLLSSQEYRRWIGFLSFVIIWLVKERVKWSKTIPHLHNLKTMRLEDEGDAERKWDLEMTQQPSRSMNDLEFKKSLKIF